MWSEQDGYVSVEKRKSRRCTEKILLSRLPCVAPIPYRRASFNSTGVGQVVQEDYVCRWGDCRCDDVLAERCVSGASPLHAVPQHTFRSSRAAARAYVTFEDEPSRTPIATGAFCLCVAPCGRVAPAADAPSRREQRPSGHRRGQAGRIRHSDRARLVL